MLYNYAMTQRPNAPVQKSAPPAVSQEKKGGNFFTNLLETLFGANDPEAIKRRQLNAIAKDFSRTKCAKFYKYSTNEALPPMARVFYEIYKITFPAKTMFQSIQNPNLMKHLTISYLTPPKIKEIEDTLDESKLVEMAKTVPVEKLKKEALVRAGQYSDYFSVDRVIQIDSLYNQIMAFKEFCTFDFYVLLRKFQKSFKEGDFTTVPQFDKVNADAILDDLKDFVAVAWSLPLDGNYDDMIKLLRQYKGVEPVTSGNWSKIIKRVMMFRTSGVFDMLLKLITSNPATVISVPAKSYAITEQYIATFKQGVEATMNKLVKIERGKKTTGISNQLFQGITESPLRFFVEEMNDTFEHKKLKTFQNTQTLSCVKTFLLEIFKKDIRDYYELVVVRGQWESQAISSSFSEAYNNLMALSDKIIKFDNDLAEDATVGMKIKNHLPKTERDSGAKNIVNRLIDDSNSTAYEYITTAFDNILIIGKTVKDLIDDIDRKSHLLISNWKELERYADIPPKEFSVKVYKQIYLLTSLIKASLVQPV